MYSQDLSNCKTSENEVTTPRPFLYSQDLSNCKTESLGGMYDALFLYSQDLSNCKTLAEFVGLMFSFCTLKI